MKWICSRIKQSDHHPIINTRDYEGDLLKENDMNHTKEWLLLIAAALGGLQHDRCSTKAATPDALDIYYYMKREQPLKLLDLRLSHSSLINLTNGWDLDSENIP